MNNYADYTTNVDNVTVLDIFFNEYEVPDFAPDPLGFLSAPKSDELDEFDTWFEAVKEELYAELLIED